MGAGCDEFEHIDPCGRPVAADAGRGFRYKYIAARIDCYGDRVVETSLQGRSTISGEAGPPISGDRPDGAGGVDHSQQIIATVHDAVVHRTG